MSKLTSFLTKDDEPMSFETRLMDETDGTSIGHFADRIGDELPEGVDTELTEGEARDDVAAALRSGEDAAWEVYLESQDAALPYHENVQPGELTGEHQETPEDAQLRLVLGSRAAKVIEVRRERLGRFDSDQPFVFSAHAPEHLAYDKDKMELAA